MLSTVVLSNENQTCRGWEATTSTGGGGCHQISIKLFKELWDGTPIRLLGVRGGKLTPDKIEQIQLFTETASSHKKREKMSKLDAALYSIQKKHGKNSIMRASKL